MSIAVLNPRPKDGTASANSASKNCHRSAAGGRESRASCRHALRQHSDEGPGSAYRCADLESHGALRFRPARVRPLQRGKDRTGTVIACYRIARDRWDNKKALSGKIMSRRPPRPRPLPRISSEPGRACFSLPSYSRQAEATCSSNSSRPPAKKWSAASIQIKFLGSLNIANCASSSARGPY